MGGRLGRLSREVGSPIMGSTMGLPPHERPRWGWKRLAARAHRVLYLPQSDRRILIEAALELVFCRIFVASIPFKRVVGVIGGTTNLRDAPARPQDVRRVAWAIETVRTRLPVELKCLPQALAARRMLRRRGIPSVLSLGARLDAQDLYAHAWLIAGGVAVTGAEEARMYGEIARFD